MSCGLQRIPQTRGEEMLDIMHPDVISLACYPEAYIYYSVNDLS